MDMESLMLRSALKDDKWDGRNSDDMKIVRFRLSLP
jgi:hypothetical protein